MDNIYSFFTKRQLMLEMLAIVIFFFFLPIFYQLAFYRRPSANPLCPNGEPDNWGSKNSLLLLPFIALGLYIFLTIAEFFPKAWNSQSK